MTVTQCASPWVTRLMMVVAVALVSTPLVAQQPSAKDLDRLAKLPMPKAHAQMKPIGELAKGTMIQGQCTGSVCGASLATTIIDRCSTAKCSGSCCQTEATVGMIVPDSLLTPEWDQPNVPFPSEHVNLAGDFACDKPCCTGLAATGCADKSCTAPCCSESDEAAVQPACSKPCCAGPACTSTPCAGPTCTKPCCSDTEKLGCCSDAPGCPGDGACGIAGCGELTFAATSCDKPCCSDAACQVTACPSAGCCDTTKCPAGCCETAQCPAGCCEGANAPRFCASNSCCPSDCQHCVDSDACKSMVRCPSDDCFDSACTDCEADCCGDCKTDMSSFISATATTMAACLDKASPEDRSKLIEATMMLVAQNAKMSAAAQVAELKRQHECELGEMRVLLIQATAHSQQASGNMHQWMNTLYGNQNRNYQQMQQLMSNNNHLNRMLMMLEKQLAREPMPPQRIVNSTFDSAAQQNAEEMRKVERQIAELQSKLEQMEKPKVQTVQHLQPLFTQPQLLAPIPTTSKRPKSKSQDGWRR